MSLPLLLTEPGSLPSLAAQLRGEGALAVDLEADSLYHYREKVCLLQISTSRRDLLIDTLAIADLEPLRDLFGDPGVRKVFHGADYDVRSLGRDFGLEVRGLFDTMVACQFLGEPRIGLADILLKYLGLNLDKRHQKADWSRRPLSDDLLNYAAMDTRHLIPAADLLEEKLIALGRLDWVREECRLLEGVRPVEPKGPDMTRVKGYEKLAPRQLAALDRLLLWREAEAARQDRPPFKVLGSAALLEAAKRLPRDAGGLKGIEGLPGYAAGRYGRSLLAAVGEALGIAEDQLPALRAREAKFLNQAESARLAALKEWRRREAETLGLHPGILINNALLEEIARRAPRSHDDFADMPGLKDWQRGRLIPGILGALGEHGAGRV